MSRCVILSVNVIVGQNSPSVNLISRLRKDQLLISPSVHHFNHILHPGVDQSPSESSAQPCRSSNPGLCMSPFNAHLHSLCPWVGAVRTSLTNCNFVFLTLNKMIIIKRSDTFRRYLRRKWSTGMEHFWVLAIDTS